MHDLFTVQEDSVAGLVGESALEEGSDLGLHKLGPNMLIPRSLNHEGELLASRSSHAEHFELLGLLVLLLREPAFRSLKLRFLALRGIHVSPWCSKALESWLQLRWVVSEVFDVSNSLQLRFPPNSIPVQVLLAPSNTLLAQLDTRI